MPDRENLNSLSKETLIDMLEDSAKNWLAHDGLWFQAVERQYGMEKAIELDKEYAYFAHTIDPRIRTTVISCPPDPHPDEYYCAWQFNLEEDPIPIEGLLRN